MKIYSILLFLTLLLTACMKGQKVDLIVHNAKIHTMDLSNSMHEAMAIRNGKIVEVGPERQILNKYRSDESIDAQGKELYPGFTDAHGHMLMYAKQLLGVDLNGVRSEQELVHRCEQYKAQHPHLQFLIGQGWDQTLWTGQQMPTNQELNRLFPDIPVCLYRIDGHAALVNDFLLKKSRALDQMKYLKGGEIVFDKNDIKVNNEAPRNSFLPRNSDKPQYGSKTIFFNKSSHWFTRGQRHEFGATFPSGLFQKSIHQSTFASSGGIVAIWHNRCARGGD